MSNTEGARVVKALRKISSNIEKLLEARELVEARSYDRALSTYLSAISGSVGNVPDLALGASLTKLVQSYPDSRLPLTERRNQLENAIEEGTNSRCLNEEWTELNKALGEDYRELQLIERLQKSHRSDTFLIFQTIKYNFEKYLRDKRYDILEPYIDRFGHNFLMQYVDFESSVLFPAALNPRRAFEDEQAIERIITDGTTLLEACLGLKRNFAASEVLQKILNASTSVDTYERLVSASNRAGAHDFAKIIFQRAKHDLSKHQLTSLRRRRN